MSGVLYVVAQRRQKPERRGKKRIARIGKECDVCGYTQEKFKQTFLFGCPECYEQMRDIAIDSALKAQGMTYADLQNPRPAFCQGGMDMHSTLFIKENPVAVILKDTKS